MHSYWKNRCEYLKILYFRDMGFDVPSTKGWDAPDGASGGQGYGFGSGEGYGGADGRFDLVPSSARDAMIESSQNEEIFDPSQPSLEPIFIESPSDDIFLLGKTFRVEVRVTGNPKPTVTWYKEKLGKRVCSRLSNDVRTNGCFVFSPRGE